MSKDLSLSKLTAFYTIGNLSSKVLGFALFFVYTFYLDKQDLGLFDLTLTTIALVAPIISLQINDAALRWSLKNREEKFLLSVVTNSCLILLCNIVIFTFIFWIATLFFELQYKSLIYILIVFQVFYLLVPPLARGTGRNSTYVIGGVLFSVVYALTTIIALAFFELKVQGLLIANIVAVATTLVFLAFKIRLFKYFDFSYASWPFSKEMIKFSLPLIPNTLSWWAISTSNRYMILFFLGVGSNGLFAIGLKFPSILLMLCSIFYMAWQEKAIKSYDLPNRDEYYSKTFNKYFSLLFGAIPVLIAITKPVLKFAVAPSYYEAWKFVPIMYLAVGFQSISSFYGTGYLSSKDTKGALTTTIYGAMTTVLFSYILIPLIGLFGASLAILLGYVIMYIARVYQTKKYFIIKFSFKKMMMFLVFIALASFCTISENVVVLFANILVCSCIFLYVNRELVMQYRSKIPFLKF